MSYYLADESCRIDGDPPPENRVVGLDAFTYSCTWSICSQTPETHPEIETTDTTTVSGILYWLSRDPIGLAGGLNLYSFVGNNPVNFIDPLGLDTYLVNREIGGSEVRSKYNPLTHTFVAVQHPDGSVSTYGWGTTYNDQKQGLWGTEVQNEWDRLTAAEAIRQGKARRVGGSDLDPYVPGAYEDISQDPTSFHRWLLWNNCKNEARDLIRRAKRLQKSDTSGDNERAK